MYELWDIIGSKLGFKRVTTCTWCGGNGFDCDSQLTVAVGLLSRTHSRHTVNMEEKPREKSEEDKARLKEERRARKKAKKLNARATKRGITVEALVKEDTARKLAEADDLPPPRKRQKRSREEDEQKVWH